MFASLPMELHLLLVADKATEYLSLRFKAWQCTSKQSCIYAEGSFEVDPFNLTVSHDSNFVNGPNHFQQH
jgi:hypothetical protein